MTEEATPPGGRVEHGVYEVKATSGDDTQFDLGISEINAATHLARKRTSHRAGGGMMVSFAREFFVRATGFSSMHTTGQSGS